MQPLYYYRDATSKSLETSPSFEYILKHVEKTSQGKTTRRFLDSDGKVVEILKCKLKNGIPQGAATKKFINGDRIEFQFNNKGMMQGEARKYFFGGRIMKFMFINGMALGEEDEKYSDDAIQQPKGRNERMHDISCESHCLTNPTTVTQEFSTQICNKKLLLDSKRLLDTVCPKNSANESALRFIVNGTDVPVDLESFILRLHHLLSTKKIILSEFKLIGSALQQILLKQQKKKGGDIDFLGYVVGENNKRVNCTDLLHVFLQVLEEVLFRQFDQGGLLPLTESKISFEDRMKKFKNKPYVLKAFSWNKDFVVVTIPLQLQDPIDSSLKTFVDIDIRINIESKSSCIASANCFEYDLLRLFLKDPPWEIPVKGAAGYENSVINAFQLLQKKQFFVHEPSAATTVNGLRAYVLLLVKGLFPVSYQSAWVYFVKWKMECKAKGSVPLGVNDFFQELEKFLIRHYSVNGGEVDFFYLSLYLTNLRTLFVTQDWSDEKWTYSKEDFFNVFDMKAFYLLKTSMANITNNDFALIRLLLFWKIAGNSQGISLITSDSSPLFTLRSTPEGYGLLTEIPWKETFYCNWQELERQMENLQPYLTKMNLPISPKGLKSAIGKAMTNPDFTSATKSSCFVEELHMQKMLRLAFQPMFDDAQFFNFFLDILNKHSEKRTKALRELIQFIRTHRPENQFQNLWSVIDDDIPALFKAVAIDLKGSEMGHKELCCCLLRPCCEAFRDKTILVIFPYLHQAQSEKYFCKFPSDKKPKISKPVFHQLLIMALESSLHRTAWEKLLKHELPLFLEAAQLDTLPSDLLNAILRFFNDHLKMQPDVIFKAFLNLLRLGCDKNQIKSSLVSCLKIHRQDAIRFYGEIFNTGLFTPQMLWELYITTPFQLEDRHFLLSLSLQCLKKEAAFLPILEQYWTDVMQQNVLPLDFLQQVDTLPNATEDFKHRVKTAMKPLSSSFQTKFFAFFKEEQFQQTSFSDLSLTDLWECLKSANFFEQGTTEFKENDWEKFISFIHPIFIKAPIQIALPVLNELFAFFPKEVPDAFKQFYRTLILENALLENAVMHISATPPSRELWSNIRLLIHSYFSYLPLGTKEIAKDTLIEAVFLKVLFCPSEEEALEVLIDLFNMIPQTQRQLEQHMQAFTNLMRISPSLYNSKHAALFWEGMLENFFACMQKQSFTPAGISEWFTKFDFHYPKLRHHIFSASAIQQYAILSDMRLNESGPLIIIDYLKKMTAVSQKNSSPVLAQEWSETWVKLKDFSWTLERCWELFRVFSNTKGSSLFPTKGKKIAGFFNLQKVIFVSTNLAIAKKDFQNNSEKNFKYMRLLHMNFIEFYRWAQVQFVTPSPLEKEIFIILSQVLREHILLHMRMLTEARQAHSTQHSEYGKFGFELLNFLITSNIFFSYEDALDFVNNIGFIASDLKDRQKFLNHIAGFACGGGVFTPVEKDTVIVNFVIRGVQELMLADEQEKALEYFIVMLPWHLSLSSPRTIVLIDHLIPQIFKQEVQPNGPLIDRLFGYVHLIKGICEYNISSKIKHQIVLNKPLTELPGMQLLMAFMQESKQSTGNEKGEKLLEQLQSLSIKYAAWQERNKPKRQFKVIK